MKSSAIPHATAKHPFRYLGFDWKFLRSSVENNADVDEMMFISNKDLIRKIEKKHADEKLSELMVKAIEDEMRRTREKEAATILDAEHRTHDDIGDDGDMLTGNSPREKKSGLFTTQVESSRSPRPPKSPRPSIARKRQGLLGRVTVLTKAAATARGRSPHDLKVKLETEKEREERIREQIKVVEIGDMFRRFLLDNDQRVPDFLKDNIAVVRSASPVAAEAHSPRHSFDDDDDM